MKVKNNTLIHGNNFLYDFIGVSPRCEGILALPLLQCSVFFKFAGTALLMSHQSI